MEKDLQFARRQNTADRHPILGRCEQHYDESYSDDELEPADHEDDIAELPSNGAKYRVATSTSDISRAGTTKLPCEPAAPGVPEYDWDFRSEESHTPPGFTYFNNQVFERVFPRLGKNPWKRDTEAYYRFPPRPCVPRMNRPHLQIVYAVLYSACFHKRKKMAKLSVMDVSRRTGIDWRTVKHDLFWLTQSGDIQVVSEGRSKARGSDGKTVWSVPLAIFDTKKQHFIKVPNFVLDQYVLAYPRAILLPVLQYIRQWQTYKGYWVDRAQDATGWPKRTIYRALRELADIRKWPEKNDTDPDVAYSLPRPLEVADLKFELRYLTFKGFRPHLVREFAEHFGIKVDERRRFG